MLRKMIQLFVAACMTVSILSVAYADTDVKKIQQEFYVSPNGNDNGAGTQGSPYKTVERARLEVQKYNKNMTGDIIVHIAEGRYELDDTLSFGVDDSGSNGYQVIYQGDRDHIPTLSGAKQISGWKEEGNGIWSVKADNFDYIRELYVNDVAAIRARNTKLTYGEANYLEPGSGSKTSDGFYINKGKIGLYDRADDMELFWGVAWKSFAFKVSEIVQDPQNADRVIVKMQQPIWDGAINTKTHSLPEQPGWNVGFIVENAYELLDEPGEFYFNKENKTLYYIPREGQDMNTAEVYCPTVDRLVHFQGENVQNKVHDIKFEDVRFAHSTWKVLEYQYQYFNQVEHPQMAGVPAMTTPGSVQLDWADNISIESCVFYGMTTVGLALAEGVTNGQFNGNVFTDIGCGAVLVGRKYHNREFDAANEDEPANVLFRKAVYTSYNMLGNIINPDHFSQQSTTTITIWRGDADAADKDIKSWVWCDLEKEYNIDSIRISFEGKDSAQINDEERSNFEILASNDPKFETYTQVSLCRGKADRVYKVNGPSDGKYRYVMVRKIVPGQFAIANMQVYSRDEKPMGEHGVCSNNYITNNYIQRVATRHLAAPGISTLFTNHAYINNNEIYDVPYSGMSLGYLWNVGIRYETSHDIYAQNNRIERYELYTNDGGGIYTLCCQPNSVVSGNYFNYEGNTWGAVYNDSSSGDYTEYDNVSENGTWPMFLNGATVQNLNVYDIYSDTIDRPDPTTDSTVVPATVYMPGSMTPEAYEIKQNAGIKSEYSYIKNRVPEGYLTFPLGIDSQASYVENGTSPMQASHYETFIRRKAENILENGTWGTLPWNYPIASKHEVSYWYDRFTSLQTNFDGDVANAHGGAYDMYELRDAYDKATYSVKHLKLAEMYQMCEEILNGISVEKKLGGYPQDSVVKFKKALEQAKAMPQNTETEQYAVTLALEKAYQELYDAKYRADIDYVYVEGGKTEIDSENRKITVKVAASCNLDQVSPEFDLSNNAKIAAKLDTMTFRAPMIIPVYNEEIKQYSYWTLHIERDALIPTGAVAPSLNPADWSDSNPNSDVVKVGGGLNLYQWYKIYNDQKDVFNGEIRIKTKINQPDTADGVNFIVSAQSNDTEYAAYYEKNTYYNAAIKGQRLELSSVKAGVSKLCFTAENIGFRYGEWNDIIIKINDSGRLDTVSVSVNGNLVVNNAYADDIGAKGYFGVMSKNETVTLGE